jgi:hypothetical protein
VVKDTDCFSIARRTFLRAALETYVEWYGRALGPRRLKEAFQAGRLAFEGQTRGGTIYATPPPGFTLAQAYLHPTENAVAFGKRTVDWSNYRASLIAGSRKKLPRPAGSQRVWLYDVMVWTPGTDTEQREHMLAAPLRDTFPPDGIPPVEFGPVDIERAIKWQWETRYPGNPMPSRDTIRRHARRPK